MPPANTTVNLPHGGVREPETRSVPATVCHNRWRHAFWLLLWSTGNVIAGAGESEWPRLLACDAVDGIAVIEYRGNEQALLRGQEDSSGAWRLTQVTVDSAVLESTAGNGLRIRAYVISSGRSAVLFDQRPPPSPPAKALSIVRARAEAKSADDDP